MRLLGIDLGTTSCKAGVFDAAGRLLGLGAAGYPTYRPQPDAAEQEPAEWWAAVRSAVADALRAAGAEAGQVAAIGLSGQIPTLVLTDRHGRPLLRAVTWQDGRGAGFAMRFSPEDLGIDLMPSHTWPAGRLNWLRQSEPELVERAAHFLMAKDWLYLRLTGRIGADASSWRGLIHLQTGRMSDAVRASVGWAEAKLPPILEPTDTDGRLRPEPAAELGLRPGTPVTVGWLDSWCNFLGSGMNRPGLGFDICGTSELAGVVTARPEHSPGLTTAPFVDGLHLLYGPTQAGGSSLDWFAQATGTTVAAALEAAAKAPPGARGLLFLPYLQGERAPIWDPLARGAFIGLHREHGLPEMARAVLEGVAFTVRQLIRAGATVPAEVIASGGGARSPLWTQIKADVLGVPVTTLEVSETGVLGAAMLAATGLGWFAGAVEAAAAMVRRTRTFQPEPDPVYAHNFGVFTGLYGALRDAFAQLAASPTQR